MAYTHRWLALANALERVMATGLSKLDAQTQLCNAMADRAVAVRVFFDKKSPADLVPDMLEGEKVPIPPRLRPKALSWETSRPLITTGVTLDDIMWRNGSIVLIELDGEDVAEIWPASRSLPEREQKPASPVTTTDSSGMEVISDRTGAQGRPTSRHLVEKEFCRRIAIDAVQDSLKAEAQALSAWLKREHGGFAPMSRKTVENCIRDPHRAWRNSK